MPTASIDSSRQPHEQSAGTFAPWVDWREEDCRGGRRLITAVNGRTGHAIRCTDSELIIAGSVDPLPDGDQIGGTVHELRSGSFLAGSPEPATAVASRRQRGDGFVWTNANRFVVRCHDAGLHRMFTRRWVVAQAVVAAVGAVLFVTAVLAFPVQLHASPAQIPIIIALGLVAVAIHELGHALVTVHYGRRVRLVGLRLHLGSPAFYVDSVDALLLSRRQRLVQAAAGPWAEWLATTVAIVALIAVPSGSGAEFLLHRFVIVNTIGIATNLLPFVGLDGSLLLSDAVREPDLADRARNALTGGGPRDVWLISYSLANTAVAGLLLVSAAFFWWQLFGDLVTSLWTWGPGGVAVLAAVAVLGSRHVLSSAVLFFPAVGCVRSRLLFRLERRWRVRSIRALCAVPEIAALDAQSLGVLAGRLIRVPANAEVSDGELSVRHGRGGRVVLPADWPRFLVPAA